MQNTGVSFRMPGGTIRTLLLPAVELVVWVDLHLPWILQPSAVNSNIPFALSPLAAAALFFAWFLATWSSIWASYGVWATVAADWPISARVIIAVNMLTLLIDESQPGTANRWVMTPGFEHQSTASHDGVNGGPARIPSPSSLRAAARFTPGRGVLGTRGFDHRQDAGPEGLGREKGRREKGSSLNRASLTPKPLASSAYLHVLEAPTPLKRLISVMSLFPLLFPSSVNLLEGKQ